MFFEPKRAEDYEENVAKAKLAEHGPAIRVGGKRVPKGHPSRSFAEASSDAASGFASDPQAGIGAVTSVESTLAVETAMGISDTAGGEEKKAVRRAKEEEVAHAHNPPMKHKEAKVQHKARTSKRMTNPMSRGTEYTGGRIQQ